MNTSPFPRYFSVDPQIKPFVQQYMQLAKERGIKFNHNVNIGFRSINRGQVAGQCHYGLFFREIDVDTKYWDYFSDISATALLYHELSHCYCGRSHDYGQNKEYGDDADKARKNPKISDGFFVDGCPKSLMFPEIVSDSCFMIHYGEYVDEMFKDCEPY